MRAASFRRPSLHAFLALLASVSSASFAYAAQLTLAWDPPIGPTPQEYVIYGYEKHKGYSSARAFASSKTTSATFAHPAPSSEVCFYAVAMYDGKPGEKSNTICVAETISPPPTTPPTITPGPSGTVTKVPSVTVTPVSSVTVTPVPSVTVTVSPSATVSPIHTVKPPTITPSVPTTATPTRAPVPLPNSVPSTGFVGLAFEQPQAGVIGLEISTQSGDVVTTFVQDTSGAGLAQKSMRGSLAVSADYDGDGRSDYSTLEPTSSGFAWRIRPSSTGSEISLPIATARKRIVSGCDFTGDKRADLLLLPSRVPFGNIRVLSEVAGIGTSRTVSLKRASGAKPERVIAGSCFDTNGDGANELVLITSNGSESRSARARYSVIAISKSGETVSQTALKGTANGIIPVPLDSKGPPLIGYYNRTSAGLISKISFVMQAGQASSITSLKIPASRDIGSGIVKSQGTAIPTLMLYTSKSTLEILNVQNIAAGYQTVSGLTQANSSGDAYVKLAVAPRSHFLVKK